MSAISATSSDQTLDSRTNSIFARLEELSLSIILNETPSGLLCFIAKSPLGRVLAIRVSAKCLYLIFFGYYLEFFNAIGCDVL